MTIKTQEIALFKACVETGSITAGAERVGISKANGSRVLKKLEQTLGVKLLKRSAHIFELTDSGQEFYREAAELLERLYQLEHRFSQVKSVVKGKLRICAPISLSQLILSDTLADFSKAFPEIELELISGSPKPKLLQENFDLILNINTPNDSSFVAKRLMKVKLNFFCSPRYLQKNGAPITAQDLLSHDCIVSLDQNREPLPWLWHEGKHAQKIRLKPRHRCDNGNIVRTMIEQDLGIALLPEFLCHGAITAKRLVKLFDDKQGYCVQIYGIYPSRKYIPAKTKAFIDHVTTNFPPVI